MAEEREPEVYRLKSGKVLSAADVEELAAEAERGYDVSKIKERKRPVRDPITDWRPEEWG